MTNLLCYTAGPFFNDDQRNTQSQVESMLDKNDITMFSPRLQGGVFLKDCSPEEREKQADAIYNKNIVHMEKCDFAVCNIDDRDTGTAWEMGYFVKSQKPTVSYSAHEYGANIMLARSVMAHFPKLEYLEVFLKNLSEVSSQEDAVVSYTVRGMVSKAIRLTEDELNMKFGGHSNE